MATSLRIKQLNGDFQEAVAAELLAEGVLAIALTLTDATNNPNFVYSATAEDNLGPLTEANYTGTLDGQPGITYNGPAGMTNHLRFACQELDLTEGTIVLEATDAFVPFVAVNSDIVAFFDTEDARASNGGVVTSVDDESIVEFHIDTVLFVEEGDVIRVGIQSRDEETDDIDVAEAGDWSIS